jgi:hypothetical protein
MVAMDMDLHESAPVRNNVETLFQPDTIASAEYFEGRRKSALEPEKELVLALIEDAVFCFKKYLESKREKEQRLFEDAETWFFDDDRQWPLSFLNVCDLLSLDPGYLRGGLLRWKKQKLGAAPPTKAGDSENQIDTNTEREEKTYGRNEKGDIDQRRRHPGGRQPERDHRRRARAAGRPRLATVRKARAL